MIRHFTPDDRQAVIDLGAEMHNETIYHSLQYDREKCGQLFDTVITQPDTYFCMVYENEEGIQAMFVGYAFPFFFSQELTSMDLLFYVKKSIRGSVGAHLLVREYVKWAQNLGVSMIQLGVSTELNVDRISKFYNKLGFRNAGRLFRYGNTDGV